MQYHRLFSGLYLTVIVGITGFNLLCQMLIMNLYLCDPAREMPPLLQKFVSCLNAVCCRRSHKVQPTKGHFPEDPNPDVEHDDTASVKAIQPDNQVMLDERFMKAVRPLLEKLEFKDQQEEWKDDWKNLARLLDMTFFIITFIAHVTMIVMYFVYVS